MLLKRDCDFVDTKPGLQLLRNAALPFTREMESCWKRCMVVVVSYYTSMMREGLAELLHFWNGRFVSKLVGFIYLLKIFVTFLCMFGKWSRAGVRCS